MLASIAYADSTSAIQQPYHVCLQLFSLLDLLVRFLFVSLCQPGMQRLNFAKKMKSMCLTVDDQAQWRVQMTHLMDQVLSAHR